MTHTLHRLGLDESILKQDFVILAMPSKDINHVGSGPKLRRFFELALEAGAIKIGDCRSGNEYYQGSVDKILENVEDRAVIHAVFKNKEGVILALKKLKKAELGMSIVVSGLFSEVEDCCRHSGLEPHSINQSLGRWGSVEKLPKNEVVEIHTMCGHGMVSVNLINKVVDRIKAGRTTPEKAAENLFKPCMCGIFNPHRAALLLRQMADQ